MSHATSILASASTLILVKMVTYIVQMYLIEWTIKALCRTSNS